MAKLEIDLPHEGQILPDNALILFAQGDRRGAIAAVKEHYAYHSSADVLIGSALDLAVKYHQLQANITHLQNEIYRLSRAPAPTDTRPRACYYCGTRYECMHR